jgi:methionyl aminopeptidase
MAEGKAHTCWSAGCGKPATQQCPTCIQLKLFPSYFCSQECFKKNWSTHKLIHVDPSTITADSFLDWRPEFRGYRFTGPLRPGRLSAPRTVPDHIQKPDYALHPRGEPESENRVRASNVVEIKTAEEIEKMRTVCRMAAEVLQETGKIVKAGMTTDQIDAFVHEWCVAHGAYPSPLRYRGFPKSCCTSLNEVICHGIPDSTILRDGDILNVDITLYYEGVHGDVNETWFIGSVDPNVKKLVDTTYEALNLAIQAVKPGVLFRDIGSIISRHVQHHGFSVVRTYCGHGIGRLFHCAPNIPHYAKNKAVGAMKPGMTFTIEPMINMGLWQDEVPLSHPPAYHNFSFLLSLLCSHFSIITHCGTCLWMGWGGVYHVMLAVARRVDCGDGGRQTLSTV